MVAGPDAIWMCVQKNSAFLRKSKNLPVMTAEQGNLLGLNQQKYSGLAHKRAVDVRSRTTGKKESILVLARAVRGSSTRSGKRQFALTGVSKNSKLAKTVEQLVQFRPDLAEEAVQKYMKVRASFRKKKLAQKIRRA
eukprot:gb/GFBE01011097.1/.p1 GENE.gb/GFBE01011097.1/~~gb/GFBE01011097.1/.p1  ORF type:complete len:137 (+),score=33.72 gb/GFBE01011097.1/:1-411(+)